MEARPANPPWVWLLFPAKWGDHQGKHDRDDGAGDGRRDAGTLGNGLDRLGPQPLLHLLGAHGFVLAGIHPGLHFLLEPVLLQLIEDAVHAAGMFLHDLAQRIGYTMMFPGKPRRQ